MYFDAHLAKLLDCLLVGRDERVRKIAERAVRHAFPDATVLCLSRWEEVAAREIGCGLALLILTNPDGVDLPEAAAAVDANGLPRWAIVGLGSTPAPDPIEMVALEDWEDASLAKVVQRSVAQHGLRRDNARLRGDLRTMGQRVMHDLRTPLGGIFSSGEALREVLGGRDSEITLLLKSLFDSVDDMQRLMERVSFLAKASANPAPKSAVAMGEVVARVLQRLERQILKTGATIGQPCGWPEVDGVSAWLETVWVNLLTNALQRAGEAAQIELGWSEADAEFRFWVLRPHGRVPVEEVSSLFQPFNLLHQPNARGGLGLSIVQRLSELQGGNCGYEPVPADGSRFFFTLPVDRRPEPGPARSAPAPSAP